MSNTTQVTGSNFSIHFKNFFQEIFTNIFTRIVNSPDFRNIAKIEGYLNQLDDNLINYMISHRDTKYVLVQKVSRMMKRRMNNVVHKEALSFLENNTDLVYKIATQFVQYKSLFYDIESKVLSSLSQRRVTVGGVMPRFPGQNIFRNIANVTQRNPFARQPANHTSGIKQVQMKSNHPRVSINLQKSQIPPGRKHHPIPVTRTPMQYKKTAHVFFTIFKNVFSILYPNLYSYLMKIFNENNSIIHKRIIDHQGLIIKIIFDNVINHAEIKCLLKNFNSFISDNDARINKILSIIGKNSSMNADTKKRFDMFIDKYKQAMISNGTAPAGNGFVQNIAQNMRQLPSFGEIWMATSNPMIVNDLYIVGKNAESLERYLKQSKNNYCEGSYRKVVGGQKKPHKTDKTNKTNKINVKPKVQALKKKQQ